MTSAQIGTISYNSEEFLQLTLNEMLEKNDILYWCYIKHKGDEDEKKDHIHVRIHPNGRIDLAALAKEFIEPVPDNLPLRCLLWRNAELHNWFMYCVHDPDYLQSKNLIRNCKYTFDNFVSSSTDDTRLFYMESREEFFNSPDYTEMVIKRELDNGVSLHDLITQGLIRPRDVFKYKQYYSALNHKLEESDVPMLIKYLNGKINKSKEDKKK